MSGEKVSDETLSQVGITIMVSIGDLILDKLDDVKDDVIKLMSLLSGLKTKEIEDLSLVDFAEMLMAIIKNPDFVDFIKVVLKSFK